MADIGTREASSTIGKLLKAMSRSELDVANARLRGRPSAVVAALAFERDESRWPGHGRLVAVVREQAGRGLDSLTIVEWVQPRLNQLAATPRDDDDGLDEYPSIREWLRPRLESIDRPLDDLPLDVVARILDGTPDLVCPNCWGRLEDRNITPDGVRSWCDACKKASAAAYRATMAPLTHLKAMAEGDSPSGKAYYEMVLLKSVDREIRYRARKLFGHDEFTMRTWDHLVDWLNYEHDIDGPTLNAMARTAVVELLRSKDEPASTDIEDRKPRAPKRRGRPPMHDAVADRKLADAYKASGLGVKEFARQKGLLAADLEKALDRHRKHGRAEGNGQKSAE